MKALNPYMKAVLGGLVAAISFAIPVVDDGLVVSEVLGIVLAGLTGTGLVYAVPNKDKHVPKHRADV